MMVQPRGWRGCFTRGAIRRHRHASKSRTKLSRGETLEVPWLHLELDKLKAAKLETAPYLYTIVTGFLSARERVAQINATYPED